MLLHVLVLAPFVAVLLVALVGGRGTSAYRLSLFSAAVLTVASVALIAGGDATTTAIDWFKLPGSDASVKYLLGSYTINAWLVFLSCVLSLAALVFGKSATPEGEFKNFSVGILALLGTMNGAFLALDAVLFFFFFEAMVIPAALLMAAYGGKERKSAAMNFAIYTLVGSAPMAIALWYMVAKSGVTTAEGLFAFLQGQSIETQTVLAISFLIAFLVKTPIFPFHGWQAAAYAESPAPLSAILTGAMSKVGVYGILIWVLSLFSLNETFFTTMLWLGLATAVYGGLMAWRGTDVKKILAFSSMGHLGLAVAAIFTLSPKMFPAVLVLLVGHGLSAGSLFLLSGVAERMTGTRELSKMGGLVKSKPVFGFLFGAAGIIALAVPGTAGFIGEFLVMLSLWDVGPLPTLAGAICLVLSAGYMLRLIQGVIFGKANQSEENPVHLGVLEGSVIGAFLFLLLLFGLRPGIIYENRTPENLETSVPAAEVVPADSLAVDSLALVNESMNTTETTVQTTDSLAKDSVKANAEVTAND